MPIDVLDPWTDRFLRSWDAGLLYELSGKKQDCNPVDAVDGRPVLKVRINGGKDLLRLSRTGSGIVGDLGGNCKKSLVYDRLARGGLARAVAVEESLKSLRFYFLSEIGTSRLAVCRFIFATSLTTRFRSMVYSDFGDFRFLSLLLIMATIL